MEAPAGYRLRRGTAADIPSLQAVERAAAQRYREVGYTFCVDGPVRDDAELRRGLRHGALIVAEDAVAPVGFALLWHVDGFAHLAELSVSMAHQGRGIGRALVAAVEARARRDGLTEITLTTFRDVPWNRPFYERLGYRAFEPGPERVELAAVIADERAWGFHARPRLVMRRELADGR